MVLFWPTKITLHLKFAPRNRQATALALCVNSSLSLEYERLTAAGAEFAEGALRLDECTTLRASSASSAPAAVNPTSSMLKSGLTPGMRFHGLRGVCVILGAIQEKQPTVEVSRGPGSLSGGNTRGLWRLGDAEEETGGVYILE
jgi:hypothetical protein